MPALIGGGPGNGDDSGVIGLQPGQAAGVAVGIVIAICVLVVFCCYLKCGICFFGAAAFKRKLKEDWHGPQPHQPPAPLLPVTQSMMPTGQGQGQGQYSPAGPRPPGPTTLTGAMRHQDSTLSPGSSAGAPPRPYLDNKVELPAGDGHAVHGPFELPATPTAEGRNGDGSRDSWRTSAATASTLLHHTPSPSYAVGLRPSLALLSPTMNRGSFIGGCEEVSEPPAAPTLLGLRSRQSLDRVVEDAQARGGGAEGGGVAEGGGGGEGGSDAGLRAAPEALRNEQGGPGALWKNRQSLVGVVEDQARGGDELKETVPPGEVEEMLRKDKWKIWRRFGGGAGPG